jgi:hypothetical protein
MRLTKLAEWAWSHYHSVRKLIGEQPLDLLMRASYEAGYNRAILELHSPGAERKCRDNTLGTGNFVSHEEWAAWLKERAAELGAEKKDGTQDA